MNCIQCFTESKRQQERERDYDRRRLEADYQRQLWLIEKIFRKTAQKSNQDGGDAFVIATFAVLALALSDEHFKERFSGFFEWSKTEQPAIQIKRDWKLEKMLRLLSEFRREGIANASELEEQLHLLKEELKDRVTAIQRTKAEAEEVKAMYTQCQNMLHLDQICGRIAAMPEGRYKKEMEAEHASEIQELNSFKTTYCSEVSLLERTEMLREQYMCLRAQLSSGERIQASRSKRYRQLLGLKMALQDVQRWRQALDLKNCAHREEAVWRGGMTER